MAFANFALNFCVLLFRLGENEIFNIFFTFTQIYFGKYPFFRMEKEVKKVTFFPS